MYMHYLAAPKYVRLTEVYFLLISSYKCCRGIKAMLHPPYKGCGSLHFFIDLS